MDVSAALQNARWGARRLSSVARGAPLVAAPLGATDWAGDWPRAAHPPILARTRAGDRTTRDPHSSRAWKTSSAGARATRIIVSVLSGTRCPSISISALPRSMTQTARCPSSGWLCLWYWLKSGGNSSTGCPRQSHQARRARCACHRERGVHLLDPIDGVVGHRHRFPLGGAGARSACCLSPSANC